MSKLQVTAEPNSHEVVMTREFNAPRDLVFKAFIDPELVAQWWGLKDSTTIVDKLEAKKGGIWRFVQRDANGEYPFSGIFHEITPSERIVYTFEFEMMPGHVLLETLRFEERDGKTLIIDSAVYQSVADRDGMIQSGMEQGAAESWDSLEALLANMIKA
jgi:uncharacterized protein YndB with AHSA1/START domain